MLREFLQQFKIDPFPLRHWCKKYTRKKAVADLKAASNVALLDFPQAMAYALIAGFPVQMGVYCSAISSLLGPLLTGSRFIILGATNATAVLLLSSLLTLNLPVEERIPAAALLLLLVGIFLIAGAFLKVANFVQYISRSVITGYITAAALFITVNQIKNVLGLEIPARATFCEVFWLTLYHLQSIQWSALLISLVTLLVLFLYRRYAKRLPHIAMTLFTLCLLAKSLTYCNIEIKMLPPVAMGTWPLFAVHFDFAYFHQMLEPALAIAFLSILESASIAKSLAARTGDRVNLNQQMLSVGVANVANAFGSGMVASGSLTRSTLNCSSGAQTPLSSIFNGCFLIAGVLLFGPLIGWIPQASLATLVIVVGLSLINWKQIRIMVKSTYSDAAAFITTLISGLLFPLDAAIFFGATVSLVLFLRKASKPELIEIAFNEAGELSELSERQKSPIPEISIVHVEGDLFFGSSEIFLDQMRFLVMDANLKVILLRLRNALHVDATSALAIGELIQFARQQGRDLIVCGARKEIEHVFIHSGLMTILGKKNFFPQITTNPNLSTRNALIRAQEIIGTDKANIIIFAKAKEKKN